MLYMEGFPPSAALHVAIMEFNSSLLSTSKWSQKPFRILEYMWVADAHAGVAALSDRWCSPGATVTLQSASKVPKLARIAFDISQFPFGFPKIWDLTRGGIDLAHEVFCLSCHFQFRAYLGPTAVSLNRAPLVVQRCQVIPFLLTRIWPASVVVLLSIAFAVGLPGHEHWVGRLCWNKLLTESGRRNAGYA